MKKILLIIIFLFIFIPINVFASKDVVKLSKCVDGDTAKFIINGKKITARFLAVDTPESVHPKKKVEPFGKEASRYTCNSLKNAKKIEIEYDSNSTKTDKYDRHLVWVFIDNELLQEKLVEKGYTKVAYLYGNYKYTNLLKAKEAVAIKNKVGIYSDDDTRNDELIDILLKIIKKLLK